MNLTEAKPVLMMNVDGTLYPVAMTKDQYDTFEMTCRLFSPIKIVADLPMGSAVNLLNGEVVK
ncbi:hypothetical protein BK128_09550 [Viridibacillus sp. FSL H7-0596]|uniref:hypothetical protein n=1 Tax=Viridibacillus sp. FSL H7-0596 TaxID=1928923 RepID=UPI00096FC31C|nr:hypothetical protein [Viridibacillus sp. FSL H7-0596]OMC86900.1 hypothetical protein BK128_09550 [Viridibacillus sp. FSL H7-0596]